MGPAESVKTCLRKYVDFGGRAPRSEFWWFILVTTIISGLLSLVDGAVVALEKIPFDPLSMLFNLSVYIPSLSVTWRRFHDCGRPGWYALLVILAPLLLMPAALAYYVFASPDFIIFLLLGIGGFLYVAAIIYYFIIPLVQPGSESENRYGPPPVAQGL